MFARVTSERIYLSVGYDRYYEQQQAISQRLGGYGSILSGLSNAMTGLANGGSLPSRTGFIEGPWLVLWTSQQQLAFNLSSADLRFGFNPIMQSTTITSSRGSSRMNTPAGKRPALAVRPHDADQWFMYALYDVTGVVLPGSQLHALADAIAAHRTPDNPAADVVEALRKLADDPFSQYQ
jgi:hypothetical protein